MAKLPKSKFKFKRNETIGAEGAEQDDEFLRDCFVDCTFPAKPNCHMAYRLIL
jgi:hypothetical protein